MPILHPVMQAFGFIHAQCIFQIVRMQKIRRLRKSRFLQEVWGMGGILTQIIHNMVLPFNAI